MFEWDSSTVHVVDCICSGNHAVGGGGCINVNADLLHMRHASSISVRNVTATLNRANEGGAFQVYGGSTTNASFEGCTVSGNHADVGGGGWYIQGDTMVTISACAVSNCSANVTASAIGATAGGSSGGGFLAFVNGSSITSPTGYASQRFLSQQVFVTGVGAVVVDDRTVAILCVGGAPVSAVRNTSYTVSTISRGQDVIGFSSNNTIVPSQIWSVQCIACGEHTYALNTSTCYGSLQNMQPCKPCPDGAECPGGTEVFSHDK